jgi:hypothetical protein
MIRPVLYTSMTSFYPSFYPTPSSSFDFKLLERDDGHMIITASREEEVLYSCDVPMDRLCVAKTPKQLQTLVRNYQAVADISDEEIDITWAVDLLGMDEVIILQRRRQTMEEQVHALKEQVAHLTKKVSDLEPKPARTLIVRNRTSATPTVEWSHPQDETVVLEKFKARIHANYKSSPDRVEKLQFLKTVTSVEELFHSRISFSYVTHIIGILHEAGFQLTTNTVTGRQHTKFEYTKPDTRPIVCTHITQLVTQLDNHIDKRIVCVQTQGEGTFYYVEQ